MAARRSRRSGPLGDRGRALLAAGATLVASGMALGFVDLVRIGALCVGLVAACAVVVTRSRPRLEIHRGIPHDTLTVDEDSTVRVRFVNRGVRGTPPYLGEDLLSPGLGATPRFLVASCAAGSASVLEYRLRPDRRGRGRIGPVVLTYSDPFGLGRLVQRGTETVDVVVLPRLHDLDPVRDVTSGTGGGGDPTHRTVTLGAADQSIRGYRAGDDLRRIHWPVTAHRGELMVREDAAPSRRRAVLVLDPPADAGGPGDRALDWAVEALASVATHLDGLGYALHLVTPDRAATGHAPDLISGADAVRTLAVVDAGPPSTASSSSASSSSASAASPRFASSNSGPRSGASASVERPAVVAAREVAGDGGLLVAATTDADPRAAHELLGSLPAATLGLLLVLDTASFAGRAGSGSAEVLAADAVAGGWHARVVGRDGSVPQTWASLVAEVSR
ncbi:DUF58 domain-containing protein [Agilicoccus flavus]|uniref:DUF58 domain-containing protein n=1 Tax=Agilicoccus flavus TaxID=2775968 RepID=UPI001CF6D983|nr:DUF58 domain-containing protein [Agilicoccus flavus]